MGRRYVTLERNQASMIQERYSCATCWSPVRVCHDERGDYISCGDDNCSCQGLVKTSTVEYMIVRNEMLAREARTVLQETVEWLRPAKREKKTEEQNMKELGF